MIEKKIILASGSAARQKMLRNAGIKFDIIPADIDEEKILKEMESEGSCSTNTSLHLAEKKAFSVAKKNPDAFVIGCDQVLSIEDKIYSKVENKEEARERLLELQGQEHFLTSSVYVVKNKEYLWRGTDVAALRMRKMDGQHIDKYIEIAGNALTDCVGCYALESVGIRLFEEIRGDYFTILGMPLLPLLNFLDKEGLAP